jgi:predicted RNA binding protein YcfA (HicA-like mRNA interferase family)
VKHVSGKRLCKVLEGMGWSRQRIRGSHHIYEHPNHPGTTLSVPVHGNKTLKGGTQKGIMKDAGLTDGDL